MNTQLTIFQILIVLLPLFGFLVAILPPKSYKKMYLAEVGILFIALILSAVLFFMKIFTLPDETIRSTFTLFTVGGSEGFNFIVDLTMDNMTVALLFMVSLISFLVHFFSLEYMADEPLKNRYFGYLGLFTFSMLGLLSTGSIIFIYIFWELVGLSSYLLIGFWGFKDEAASACSKAFITNRVGDFGFFLGILMLFITYNSFDLFYIFDQIGAGKYPLGSEMWLTVTGLLLFAGAVGKSAQFPLHVWLPDAMAGPTPVSALIHAATMVAAGVYMIVRLFPLFTESSFLIIGFIGGFSALMAATIALTQIDIKKILAYSTVSQLGLMVLAVGVGAYHAAIIHLLFHAFFKAGLFLGSGAIIHATHSQDINDMGGLRKKMPVTFYTTLIYSLALVGFPLTIGFLSKEMILTSSITLGSLSGNYIYFIFAVLTSTLTSFYIFRYVFLIFFGEPRNHHAYEHAHDFNIFIKLPLILLAVLCFFFIFTFNPITVHGTWLTDLIFRLPNILLPGNVTYSFLTKEVAGSIYSESYTHTMHASEIVVTIISLCIISGGIGTAWYMYMKKKLVPKVPEGFLGKVYLFSQKAWYINQLYDVTVIKGTMLFATLMTIIDKYLVDGLVNLGAKITMLLGKFSAGFDKYVVDGLVNLVAWINGLISMIVRKFQTGKVQTYLTLVMVFIVFFVMYIFSN